MKRLSITRGFTIIELLTVIAIIGILASIVLVSTSQARGIARDNERIAQLENMRLALRLYYEKHGQYPESCNGTGAWVAEAGATMATRCSDLSDPYIPDLVNEGFVSELPTDPKAGTNNVQNSGYWYYVSGNRQNYKFMAHNTAEVKVPEDYYHQYTRCPQPAGTHAGGDATVPCPGFSMNDRPFPKTYAIYTPGAETW